MEFANYIEAIDEPGLSIKPGRIHLGGNSGYQLVNLVAQWSPSRIVLLAYDMRRGPGGESHHHGDHDGGLPNLGADLAEWARRFVQLGIDLRGQGVEVVNASRRTAITCFERLPIVQALNPVKHPKFAKGFTASLLIPQELLPLEYAAFRAGLFAADYRPASEKPDLSVIWGTYKGKPSGKVIVAENGYWNGPDGPYCALALGGHNGAGKWPEGNRERFERLGIELKPWRKDGGHVLVCPSRGLGQNPMPKDWTARTVEELRRHTDREIKVRPHPGNWKRIAGQVEASLAKDLENAWACVIWASTAGLRALVAGIPVIRTAPHWIAAGAAGNDLAQIEAPPMPDRMPAFQRMASAQWSLSEIESGLPFRALQEMGELTVLCVLKSGGDYTPEYVRKLRDGVARNLSIPHRFVCLSDVDVPCERIPLKHGWRGWWSKLEIFRPDVTTDRTLYLDLDTVIVGNMDAVATIPYDFAMLNIRAKDTKVGNSGAMWIGKPFPHVYERFLEKPDYWMDYHLKNAQDRYMGDQAFISDCFEEIPKLHNALPGFFKSYKYDHCQSEIPSGCSVVCFGGPPRPHQARGWVEQAWV